MKTLGPFSPKAASLAVAASLVLFAGSIHASGPAGGAAVGNGGGAVSMGAPGGISGAGFSGAGRGGGLSSRSAISGPRAGVQFSNNGGIARSTSFRGNGAPSALSPAYRTGPRLGTGFAAPRTVTAPVVSRPANAWSGMGVNQGNNSNATALRNTARPTYRSNGWTDNHGFTGQHLYSGTPGSNLPTYNRGDYGHNRGGNRSYYLRDRYSYYPYAYGPAYAPYISYFGGGYYGGAYPYYNDVPAADTQFTEGANTVSPQYVEQEPAPANDNQDNSTDQPTPAPARQNPGSADHGTIPNNGPDSLVEAVQQELVQRGYFGGKVDAMYSPDTKEALRKFQTDHHLAATGLINEATLHALQLD